MENLELVANERICPSCNVPTTDSLLGESEYRCPKCGFEMAHVDTAPNGSIRGVFGFLLSVGETVEDRYVIRRVLGKGGFGATYLIEDTKLKGKRRALKEVPALLFDEHEVNLLSHMNHPSIPDIIDRFVTGEMVYLIMEFGGRQTLGSECRRLGGRIPFSRLIPLMRQLCDALGYLHGQDPPIIHRDLKPDNVLLDDNDRIMLIDFGIAKESSQGTTRMMARAASHGFSPPEQVLGTGTDERSDIYSFGATLFYALTGKLPAAAHERVAGKELERPSTLVPGLPPEWDDMLLSTMSLNLNQRPARISELKSMLDALSNLTMPDSAPASHTVRLGPGTGGIPSLQPSTSGARVTGINIATSEPIPPKAGARETQPRKDFKPVLGIAAALIVALAIAAYFLLREKPAEKATAQQPPISGSEQQTRPGAPLPYSPTPQTQQSGAVGTAGPASAPVNSAAPSAAGTANAPGTPGITGTASTPGEPGAQSMPGTSGPSSAPNPAAITGVPTAPGIQGPAYTPSDNQATQTKPEPAQSAEDLLKARRAEPVASAPEEPEEKEARPKPRKPAVHSPSKGGAPPPARRF